MLLQGRSVYFSDTFMSDKPLEHLGEQPTDSDIEKVPLPLSSPIKQFEAGYSDRWSRRLLTWGVEARGSFSISQSSQPSPLNGPPWLRHPSGSCRRTYRLAIQQDFFHLVYNELQYPLVRISQSLDTNQVLITLQLFSGHPWTRSIWSWPAGFVSGDTVLQFAMLCSPCLFVGVFSMSVPHNAELTAGQYGAQDWVCVRWCRLGTVSGTSPKLVAIKRNFYATQILWCYPTLYF